MDFSPVRIVSVPVASIAEVSEQGAKNYMLQLARATDERALGKNCAFFEISPLRESGKLQRLADRKKMEGCDESEF
jgi:hypothetical protein